VKSRSSRSSRSTVRLWGAVLLAASLIAAVLTYRDYGISWDETVQSTYGELVVDYYRSGFNDTRCNEYKNLMHYGPLFEGACALVYRSTGFDKYHTRHLLSALAGLGLVAAVMRLGWLGFGSARPALLAGLVLLLSPRVYGHFFINSKDIPFACGFAWSMVAIVTLCSARGFSWRRAVVAGVVIGLTLAVRIGGLFLIPLLAAALLFAALHGRRDATSGGVPFRGRVGGAILALFIAWIVMTVCWPATHADPVRFPLAAFEVARNFQSSVPVLFEGKEWPSSALPRYYLPRMILVTTPPLFLLAALLGLAAGVRRIAGRRWGREVPFLGVILLWFFMPIALAVIFKPNVYDGTRHFLFIVPAMALLAGFGAETGLRILPTKIKRAGTALVIVLLLLPIADLVRLHPYEMTYFNFLARHDGTARGGYETDYWATSYREGMEWIKGDSKGREKTTVLVVASPFFQVCAEHFKWPGATLRYTVDQARPGKLPEGVDYYLATTRYGFHRNYPESPVAHVIGRKDRAFVFIRKAESGADAAGVVDGAGPVDGAQQ